MASEGQLDPPSERDAILMELVAAWRSRPLPELLDHVQAEFHRPLREALPASVAQAERVVARYRGSGSAPLARLLPQLRALERELLEHLEQEQTILFPWIRRAQRPASLLPIQLMERDHARVSGQLEAVRVTTSALARDLSGCALVEDLQVRLEEVASLLHPLVLLEDLVLYPRIRWAGLGEARDVELRLAR